jgi:hypothetical protein
MMAELSVQIVLSALQTTGLLVGIFYYIMTLRNTRKSQQQALETRQAQLFMQVYKEVCTPEWWQRYYAITKFNKMNNEEMEEMVRTDAELNSEQSAVFSFFEGLGVLVKKELIDPSLVDDLLSSAIIIYWERVEPFFLERRKRVRLGSVQAEWIEYLYHQIKPIYEEQHPEHAP